MLFDQNTFKVSIKTNFKEKIRPIGESREGGMGGDGTAVPLPLQDLIFLGIGIK